MLGVLAWQSFFRCACHAYLIKIESNNKAVERRVEKSKNRKKVNWKNKGKWGEIKVKRRRKLKKKKSERVEKKGLSTQPLTTKHKVDLIVTATKRLYAKCCCGNLPTAICTMLI